MNVVVKKGFSVAVVEVSPEVAAAVVVGGPVVKTSAVALQMGSAGPEGPAAAWAEALKMTLLKSKEPISHERQ